MPYDYEGLWYDDDYGNRSIEYDPCSICGYDGYCDPVIHADYDARIAVYELNLSSYKCTLCGEKLVYECEYPPDGSSITSQIWVRCEDKNCAKNHFALVTDDYQIIGLWRGYGDLSDARYRSQPVDLTDNDIPF